MSLGINTDNRNLLEKAAKGAVDLFGTEESYIKDTFLQEKGDTKLNRRVYNEKIQPFVKNILNGTVDKTTIGKDYDKFIEAMKFVNKVKSK
jgi:hypothetical protein